MIKILFRSWKLPLYTRDKDKIKHDIFEISGDYSFPFFSKIKKHNIFLTNDYSNKIEPSLSEIYSDIHVNQNDIKLTMKNTGREISVNEAVEYYLKNH